MLRKSAAAYRPGPALRNSEEETSAWIRWISMDFLRFFDYCIIDLGAITTWQTSAEKGSTEAYTCTCSSDSSWPTKALDNLKKHSAVLDSLLKTQIVHSKPDRNACIVEAAFPISPHGKFWRQIHNFIA